MWYTLHLWNTWKDNESSQIEEVDFESKDIYIFSPFSLFVSVYVYASVCDFVCIALIVPFVLGFCLSIFFFFFFFSIVFSTCYHWWIWVSVWLLSSFFPFLFLLLFKFFSIIVFYFTNLILFYHFLYFFLFFSFLFWAMWITGSWCSGQASGLCIWGGRTKFRIGIPETSQLHIISNGKNLPEISISMPRPKSTQRPGSYSAGHPMPNN